MVSYRQLDQFGIKQIVLHERETTSSGRPKPQRPKEDANCFYVYTRSGTTSCTPKSGHDKYWDWLIKEVRYANVTQQNKGRQGTGTATQVSNNITDHIVRITPASPYEIEWGFGALNPLALQKHYYNIAPPNRKREALKLSGAKGYVIEQVKEMEKEHIRKMQEAQDEADRLAQLAEQERLKKLRETARPNPREVEKPAPVEIEPIKEVVKYSPLMIAGIIAIIVVLFLKRRA